jgi:Protein phosphatase 2C
MDAAQQAFLDGQEPASEQGWTDILYRVLAAARHAVEAVATQSLTTLPSELIESLETQPLLLAAPLREYATTLLLAIMSQEWIALLQLGDGMIVVQPHSGACWCPVPPSNDSQYVNDTHFLTDPDYRHHVHIASLHAVDVHGVALLTDGLQVLASTMTTQQPYPPFFSPLFAFAAKPTATDADLEVFLQSERVCQRTDDDTTLVLAVRI